MTTSRRHHYVPRFLLDGFTDSDGNLSVVRRTTLIRDDDDVFRGDRAPASGTPLPRRVIQGRVTSAGRCAVPERARTCLPGSVQCPHRRT
jgi:hypothetical protein